MFLRFFHILHSSWIIDQFTFWLLAVNRCKGIVFNYSLTTICCSLDIFDSSEQSSLYLIFYIVTFYFEHYKSKFFILNVCGEIHIHIQISSIPNNFLSILVFERRCISKTIVSHNLTIIFESYSNYTSKMSRTNTLSYHSSFHRTSKLKCTISHCLPEDVLPTRKLFSMQDC